MKTSNFRLLIKLLMLSILLLSSHLVNAEDIGTVANNLSTVFEGGRQILNFTCVILGVALIISAIIRYSRHRQNPIEVPINIPIVLFILGILLIILPYSHQLSLYFSSKAGIENVQE